MLEELIFFFKIDLIIWEREWGEEGQRGERESQVDFPLDKDSDSWLGSELWDYNLSQYQKSET